MKKLLQIILPKTINNDYKGNKLALYTFIVIASLSAGRSLIHFLASDGGANSIAGLDISEGGKNIIFSFSLWGLSQLLFAIVQLLVAFKYRSLIPLFYLLLFFEIIGRMYVGFTKVPVLLEGTPPGGIANYILLPIIIIMFFLSINYEQKKNSQYIEIS